MLLILTSRFIATDGIGETLGHLGDLLTQKDVPYLIADFSQVEFSLATNSTQIFIQGKPLQDFSFIFFRKVGPYRHAAFVIARQAEQYKIPFADHLYRETSESGKFKQTFVLANQGLPIPKTYFSTTYDIEKLKRAAALLGFPLIIKASRAHRGEGIFLVKEFNALQTQIERLGNNEVLLQEFIPNTFDYRIVVFGEEIGSAERRIRQTNEEFRNNISLGAREEFIPVNQLDETLAQLAIQAARVADIQIAGVDIVVGKDGQARLFEINRCPGFTSDLAQSSEIPMLAEYLKKQTKKK